MELSDLIGKTIKSCKYRGVEGYDDEPYLDIVFEDGTSVTVSGGYGCYTGNSEDEYPRCVVVRENTVKEVHM